MALVCPTTDNTLKDGRISCAKAQIYVHLYKEKIETHGYTAVCTHLEFKTNQTL